MPGMKKPNDHEEPTKVIRSKPTSALCCYTPVVDMFKIGNVDFTIFLVYFHMITIFLHVLSLKKRELNSPKGSLNNHVLEFR